MHVEVAGREQNRSLLSDEIWSTAVDCGINHGITSLASRISLWLTLQTANHKTFPTASGQTGKGYLCYILLTPKNLVNNVKDDVIVGIPELISKLKAVICEYYSDVRRGITFSLGTPTILRREWDPWLERQRYLMNIKY